MKKILLCILDGVGISSNLKGNAFSNANKPNYNFLINKYPHSLLQASGTLVGLPEGQMGNSEVGHTNIGAGRIVYQSLEYINNAIKNGTFYQNDKLLEVINHVKESNTNLHIMGLLSDGGIHSHINHLLSLIDLVKEHNLSKVYYHIFLDGRDTSISSGKKYLKILLDKIEETNVGSIASVSGRYYAMDRDNNFERIEKVYNTIVLGENNQFSDCLEAWDYYQEKGITDEFVEPCLLNKEGLIKENDGIICFNYRPDRLRELFSILTNSEYKQLNMNSINNVKFVSFMPINDTVKGSYAFKLDEIKNTLGDYLSYNNLKQLRIAETEKYAHVTYFFDGGIEKDLEGCTRILIDSPKVATYDLKPEMSAYEVTDKLLECMNKNEYDVIILNYANGDMVGHTGSYEASKKAVEVLDECLGKIIENLNDYTLVLTADHGNCEVMLNEDGSINTYHSSNLVPFIITDENIKLKDGKLGDIAPTILKLMDLEIPKEMEGNVLIENEEEKV